MGSANVLRGVSRPKSAAYTAQRPGVFRAGTGAPLLLLHAGGVTWRQWIPLLPALTAQRDVLALTLAGNRGGPALIQGRHVVEHVVDEIERELDLAGLWRVDVVGNSIGGYAAFELARRGRVRRLVAISPMGMQTTEEAARVTAALRRGHRVAQLIKPLVLPALALAPLRRRLLWFMLGMVHGERVSPGLARHLFHAMTKADVASAFASDGAELQIRDVAAIDVPALIVRGARDPLARRAHIDRYLADLPDALLVELADTGHCAQLEQPDQVAALILDFTDIAPRET